MITIIMDRDIVKVMLKGNLREHWLLKKNEFGGLLLERGEKT
jgi:hypothetical protein